MDIGSDDLGNYIFRDPQSLYIIITTI